MSMDRHRVGTKAWQFRRAFAGSVDAGWRVDASPPKGGEWGLVVA
jgi:hypothetical protein